MVCDSSSKFRYGVLTGSYVAMFTFFSIFRPQDFGLLLPISNLMDSNFNKRVIEDTSIAGHLDTEIKEAKYICNTKEGRSDFCELTGDIRIQGNSSSVHIASFQGNHITEKPSYIIRPYSRRAPSVPMHSIKNWTIISTHPYNKTPQCDVHHTVPAVLLSTGGYLGNHFHDFSDLIIPLFITSQHFNGQVQFVMTNYKSWWMSKFRHVFQRLTKYKIIDIDSEEYVHCYSSVTVGLRCPVKELGIDPLNSPTGLLSMYDFRLFLRSTYGLKRTNAVQLRDGEGTDTIKKPRLMIISRSKTRRFENIDEINKIARRLGFEVMIVDDSKSRDVAKFAEIVNSCDVMMGVHGAGLTNMVFLPDNAVVIQVVPFGNIDELARTDFREPTEDMKLSYLEYKISVNESTLIRQYPADHEIIRDPLSISKHGWYSVSSIYLQKQDVKLDVKRFKSTLSTALELLHH